MDAIVFPALRLDLPAPETNPRLFWTRGHKRCGQPTLGIPAPYICQARGCCTKARDKQMGHCVQGGVDKYVYPHLLCLYRKMGSHVGSIDFNILEAWIHPHNLSEWVQIKSLSFSLNWFTPFDVIETDEMQEEPAWSHPTQPSPSVHQPPKLCGVVRQQWIKMLPGQQLQCMSALCQDVADVLQATTEGDADGLYTMTTTVMWCGVHAGIQSISGFVWFCVKKQTLMSGARQRHIPGPLSVAPLSGA